MGDWDGIHRALLKLDLVRKADNVGQLLNRENRGNGELPDGNEKLGLQNLDFSLEPTRAVFDLFCVRHAVAALWVLPWKTAADGGHVDAGPKRLLIETEGREPLEQGLAGGPGERLPELTLVRSRCLAKQQDVRENGRWGDHWAHHFWTG